MYQVTSALVFMRKNNKVTLLLFLLIGNIWLIVS